MRIALINGSPKVKNSASGALLEDLKGYLGEKAEVVDFSFHAATISKEIIEVLTDRKKQVYNLFRKQKILPFSPKVAW